MDFSANNKRYFTYDQYLKNRFSKKIIKVSLNAGFSCPNIDGTKGFNGCDFCSEKLSGEFAGDINASLYDQFNSVREKLLSKWKDAYCIAYFQAGTNTYASTEVLRQKFEEALTFKDVVGISISTRPDSISDETLEYLAELSKRTYLNVELGLQSIHNKTLLDINRGHSYEEFLSCYEKLRARDINVSVHIINGLPNETHEMMLETAKELSKLEIHSIKIHLLHIIKNTNFAKRYENGEFPALSFEEYIKIVCDQLEVLDEKIVIGRLTGDGSRETLVAPEWSVRKFEVLNGIDKELVRRNSFQGKYFSK